MSEDVLLTVDEVARRLSVHPETVRKWIKNKEIEAINLGGPAGYRISEAALKEFLQRRTGAAKKDDK
jgi:excisionase family DNA binding protein